MWLCVLTSNIMPSIKVNICIQPGRALSCPTQKYKALGHDGSCPARAPTKIFIIGKLFLKHAYNPFPFSVSEISFYGKWNLVPSRGQYRIRYDGTCAICSCSGQFSRTVVGGVWIIRLTIGQQSEGMVLTTNKHDAKLMLNSNIWSSNIISLLIDWW